MEASVTTTPANQPPTSTACCKPTHNFHHPASVGQRWLDDKTDRTLFTVHVGKPPALKSTTEVVHSGFAEVKKFVLFRIFQFDCQCLIKFLRHLKINNFNEKKPTVTRTPGRITACGSSNWKPSNENQFWAGRQTNCRQIELNERAGWVACVVGGWFWGKAPG